MNRPNRNRTDRHLTRLSWRSWAAGGLAAALAALSIGTGAANATPTSAPPPEAPLTVTVDSGQLHGMATGSTRQFLGVPYAKPPVGALRWAPPQPAAHWTGVREATTAGSFCPQQGLPLGYCRRTG